MKRPQGFDSPSPNQPNQPSQPKSTRRTPAKKVRVPAPKRPTATSSSAQTSATPLRPSDRASGKIPAAGEVRRTNAQLRASARERRRFERREVRRFTRRTRHRRFAWWGALATAALLVALLAVAVYSPLLALRTITVDGVSKVSAQDVREAIDGQLGTPLALLDYGALRTELDAFPLIRSFSTEIVPPSTLRVHIVERSPVGVVSSPSGFQVVDPAGVVLESTPRRPDGIPLIDVGGAKTDSVAFTAVVDVLLALPDSIRSRVDVAQATSKDDVQLVLAEAGQRVRWGSSERSALKARVLEELMAVQGSGGSVEFDVSAPMSPVVRSR